MEDSVSDQQTGSHRTSQRIKSGNNTNHMHFARTHSSALTLSVSSAGKWPSCVDTKLRSSKQRASLLNVNWDWRLAVTLTPQRIELHQSSEEMSSFEKKLRFTPQIIKGSTKFYTFILVLELCPTSQSSVEMPSLVMSEDLITIVILQQILIKWEYFINFQLMTSL